MGSEEKKAEYILSLLEVDVKKGSYRSVIEVPVEAEVIVVGVANPDTLRVRALKNDGLSP